MNQAAEGKAFCQYFTDEWNVTRFYLLSKGKLRITRETRAAWERYVAEINKRREESWF